MQSIMRISRRALVQSFAFFPAVAGKAFQVPSPAESDRTTWNGVYTNEDSRIANYPNRFLAEVVRDRKAGRALDIGMGQGRNSLFLARLGWDVTGVDVSDKAIDLAKKEAARLDLKISCVVSDFLVFDVGKDRWDLIIGMYMGRLILSRAPQVAEGLASGGLLAVEHYRRDINRNSLAGGRLGYPVNALLEAFAPQLRIVRYEEVLDFPDWGDQGERVPLVRMLARKG
jgi:SAM-dependent methyltransferase